MLTQVQCEPRHLSAYEGLADLAMLTEIRALAAPLRGLKVVHINATPNGGGVAEILHSLVPLSRDLGIRASWYTLPPDNAFFSVTKQFHNWMQGQCGELRAQHQRTYAAYLERLASQMRDETLAVAVAVARPIQVRSLRSAPRCWLTSSSISPWAEHTWPFLHSSAISVAPLVDLAIAINHLVAVRVNGPGFHTPPWDTTPAGSSVS